MTVIGVTTDNEEQQAAYVKELGLPYLLFSDERRIAVSQLGIPTSEVRGNVNAEPTAFAVGVDGTILDIVEQATPEGPRRASARGDLPAGLDRCSPSGATPPASRCASRRSRSRSRRAPRSGSGSAAAACATPTCTSPAPIGSASCGR